MEDLTVEPKNLPVYNKPEHQVPMDVELAAPEQDLQNKITGKPAPALQPEPAPLFASCDVRFKTANQIAIDKKIAEKLKKKLKFKYKRNRIADALKEYEKKLPASTSVARKVSADRSPERRGRKRGRSSSLL